MTENRPRQNCRAKSVRANGPNKKNNMKGALSLNNLLDGTVRAPDFVGGLSHGFLSHEQ